MTDAMKTARPRAYSLFECGCPRGRVEVIRREPLKGNYGPPTLIRTETHGTHDPRKPHSERVPVRAWASDTYPGRP